MIVFGSLSSRLAKDWCVSVAMASLQTDPVIKRLVLLLILNLVDASWLRWILVG